MKITKKEVAECVGLWLAEGDNKTTKEVTFTNNCLELVLFFHENIKKLYTGKNNSRLYIYSSTPRVLVSNLNGLVIRNYIDNRANKTYYIFRLSDVKFVRKWKELVKNLKNNKNFYSD
ncbi:MAG: hypothetical protein KJ597_00370, partial [Nanoarchaeota archaeon]|nr:hypothetical protein [Nanoarchaeota archaeon]